MYRIYKYQILPHYEQTISMPKDAKILSVQVQKGNAQMWCLINTDNEYCSEARHFRVIGTGHDILEGEMEQLEYITTFQLDKGEYVWHLFERKQS